MESVALAFLIIAFAAAPSSASTLIALGDVALAPGGTGTMDITVTSDTGDTLSAFFLQLLITPSAGSSQSLSFTSSQPTVYDQPNYVFAGSSFNQDNGLPFWYPPTITTYLNDTISGGDTSDSAAGYVTIPATAGSGNSFMAAVQFYLQPGTSLSDSFQVSLTSASVLYDQDGNALMDVTSTGGLVTISSVPEPSTLVLGAFSGLSGLVVYRRKRGRSRKDIGLTLGH